MILVVDGGFAGGDREARGGRQGVGGVQGAPVRGRPRALLLGAEQDHRWCHEHGYGLGLISLGPPIVSCMIPQTVNSFVQPAKMSVAALLSCS